MPNNVDYSKNSPNFTDNSQVRNVFGYPRTIDWITIHWWGDPNQNPSFEGVVAWLCNPRSQVSAHDVITGTGSRVAVIVDYVSAAWHTGSALGNASSLGFECDPRARDEDYEAVAQDVAETWRYYGREVPLRGHNTWVGTQCPGVYDINRINNRARQINNTTATPTATAEDVKKAYLDILERTADAGGIKTYTTNGMTAAGVRDDLMKSPERKTLESKKQAEYDNNEWVRNKKDIKDELYAVLPASGVRPVDLVTSQSKGDIIPRGTMVDVVFETSVKGKRYYISAWSYNNGQATGILADDLAVPATPPVQEKPEWLKNLKDIEDVDMWTRSETPVLDIENGDVVDTLAVNTRVKVTHATQIVGKDLLVLEGSKKVIETLYLSDKKITDPYDDLEARVSAIERIWQLVIEFFTNLGKR